MYVTWREPQNKHGRAIFGIFLFKSPIVRHRRIDLLTNTLSYARPAIRITVVLTLPSGHHSLSA